MPHGRKLECNYPTVPDDAARDCGAWQPPKPKKLDFADYHKRRVCDKFQIIENMRQASINPNTIKDYHQTICRKRKFCPCLQKKDDKNKKGKSCHVFNQCPKGDQLSQFLFSTIRKEFNFFQRNIPKISSLYSKRILNFLARSKNYITAHV